MVFESSIIQDGTHRQKQNIGQELEEQVQT